MSFFPSSFSRSSSQRTTIPNSKTLKTIEFSAFSAHATTNLFVEDEEDNDVVIEVNSGGAQKRLDQPQGKRTSDGRSDVVVNTLSDKQIDVSKSSNGKASEIIEKFARWNEGKIRKVMNGEEKSGLPNGFEALDDFEDFEKKVEMGFRKGHVRHEQYSKH